MTPRKNWQTAITDDVPECRECGCCCVLPMNYRLVTKLTKKDLERLSSYYRERRTRLIDHGGYRTLTHYPKHPDGWACTAFSGRVNKKCRCSIYSTRPWRCRMFKPGSQQCLDRIKARKELEKQGVQGLVK